MVLTTENNRLIYIKRYIIINSEKNENIIPFLLNLWEKYQKKDLFLYIKDNNSKNYHTKDFPIKFKDILIVLNNMFFFINDKNCNIDDIYLKYIFNNNNNKFCETIDDYHLPKSRKQKSNKVLSNY